MQGRASRVLIVASNAEADRRPGYLPFSRLQTTEGRGFVLLRPYHLCHLEAVNTLNRVAAGEPVLLNNSAHPRYTVASVAKRPIRTGSVIRKGAGSFDVRGQAVPLADHRDAVPICLLRDSVVVRNIKPGQVVRFDDVVMAESRTLSFYRSISEAPLAQKKSKVYSEHMFFLGMTEFANGWPLQLCAML